MPLSKLRVFKIPHMDTIVIKQTGGNAFFVSTQDSIVLHMFGLTSILKFLLFSRIMSPKVLEGLLEEYNSYVREISKN